METAVKLPDTITKDADSDTSNHVTGTARCVRCGGLMVVETCIDFWDHVEKDVAVGRCVQCGERIDPVILRNRQRHGVSPLGRGKNESAVLRR
jgi:hypothetical protein